MKAKVSLFIFLVCFLLSVSQLFPSNAGTVDNSENFVDSNTSNIDSHIGHGTSSNFTAQQDANVLFNDTLTEANISNSTGVLGSSTASTTGSTTIESQIVGSLFTPSNSGWLSNIMAYIGVTTAIKNGGASLYRHSDLVWIANTSMVSLAIATSWRTFMFAEPYPAVVSGTDYILVAWCATGSGNGLLYYGSGATNQGHIDPQTWGAWPNPLVPTTHNAFKYDINASMILPNYEFDYEFSWTTADFDEVNEYLCIRTNSFTGTAENLGVDVWNGAGWTSISSALTASAWNNISITIYLTSVTIYFRFIGKTESSDTAQNTWQIECNLIHTWSTDYPLDLNTTATMTLSTIVQVNYYVAINQTTSLELTLSSVKTEYEATIYPINLDNTASISLNTIIQVEYNAIDQTSATIGLATILQVSYHVTIDQITSVGLNLTSLNMSGAKTYPLDFELTSSVSLVTDVKVTYQVGISQTTSIGLNLTSEADYQISSDTGTISLTVLVQVMHGVPSNVSGVVTFDVLVQTSYNVEVSETTTLGIEMSVVQSGSGTLYQVPTNVSGVMGFSLAVKVDYHVTASETQTITIIDPPTPTTYTRLLSLSPDVGLTVVISGNFSSPSTGSWSWTQTYSGNVFDVRIVKIAYIYRVEQIGLARTVVATMNMTNMATVSGDAVVQWWVTSAMGTRILDRSETVFVGKGQSQPLTCTFDLEKGDYVFNAQVKSIAGYPLMSPATATLGFSVGYIYTDFIQDNYVLLLIIGFLMVIIIQRRKKVSIFKHRKRKRRR